MLEIVRYLRVPVLSLMTKFFALPVEFNDTCESSVPKRNNNVPFGHDGIKKYYYKTDVFMPCLNYCYILYGLNRDLLQVAQGF